MILVEQHIISQEHKLYKKFDYICWLSKNLYNCGLYIVKQEFLKSGKWIRYGDLDKLVRCIYESDYRHISCSSSQQILMSLDNNLKSYFKAIKAWKRDNKKFTGCPKFPKYKHKEQGRNIFIYSNGQVKVKDGYIHFPKKEGLPPLKTKAENIKQVRVVPKCGSYCIEVVYEVADKKEKECNGNFVGIDLGVNNLATLSDGLIINGRPLKSINQYYNKTLADIKQRNKKNHGKETSKRARKFTLKRNNKVKDYMHKASKAIVKHCVNNQINTLIVGHNEGWKQECELGKRNNQNFIQLPFDMFINQLRYKSARQGLRFIVTEESYTSKCSASDMEEIGKHDTYMGKRVKRGLFRDSRGRLFNADLNGACNIRRKVSGDAVPPPTSIGLAFNPVKIYLY